MQQLIQPVGQVISVAFVAKLLTSLMSKALLFQKSPYDMSLAEIHEEMKRINEAEATLTERKAWRADVLGYLAEALVAIKRRNQGRALSGLRSAISSLSYYRRRYPEARSTALSIDSAIQEVHRRNWPRAEAIIEREREKLARDIRAAERETESMAARYNALDRARRKKLAYVLALTKEEE